MNTPVTGSQVVDRVLDIPLQNAELPGFMLGAFRTQVGTQAAEHGIIYRPSIEGLGPYPLVRINSACFTGDIFGDRRCDCSEQFQAALKRILVEPGLVIYHFHHDGRGLGYTTKLAAYKKMLEEDKDSFEATCDVASRADIRVYSSTAAILHNLGITRLRLLTNNPWKRSALEARGIEVVEMVGIVSTREDLRNYLLSKQLRQGHLINRHNTSSGDTA
jgi:GTP cyclohydrolase II